MNWLVRKRGEWVDTEGKDDKGDKVGRKAGKEKQRELLK